MISVKIKRKKATHFDVMDELIQLRRPKAKDLFGLDFSGVNGMSSCAVLISRLSNLSVDEVEDLDSKEFIKLQNEINKFLT